MKNPEIRHPVELSALSLKDLQKFGMENPANLKYRVEVATRIAKSTMTSKGIFYDEISESNDTPWKIKKKQKFERVILPGLLMAPGFEKGAVTVVAGLPTEAEICSAKMLKKHMEQDLGKKVNYEILFEYEGKIINLMTINHDDYNRVNNSFTRKVANGDYSHFGVDYHAGVIKDHLSTTLLPDDKAFIMPFVRRNDHDHIFVKEIKSGRVVLPDIPYMDKASNTLLLREHGFKHLPEMVIVGSNGKIIASHKELLSDETVNKGREKNSENISTLAKGVLKAIKKLHDEKGLKAYVILDPEATGGSGNLDPEIESYAKIYDNKVGPEEKQKIMEGAIDKMFGDTLPPRSIVAEFIEPGVRQGVKTEYTTRGQMVEGVLLFNSFNLIGINKAKNDHQWTSLNAEAIGEDTNMRKEMFAITVQAADIISKHSGYNIGDFAVDIFVRKDGSLVVHDFNLRRGGATAPGALLPFLPDNDKSGLFEAKVKIQIPEMSFKDRVALYDKTTDKLFSVGIIPFGTSSKDDEGNGQDALTFSVIMLADRIAGPDGECLARDKHFEYVTMKVREAMQPERKIIEKTVYSSNLALYNY